MLDRAHAALQAARDRPRGVGVAGDVQVGRLGLLDGGADLLDGELDAVDPVGGRGDAAAEHELDVVRAAADLLARGAAHLGHAVADPAAHGHGVGRLERHAPAGALVGVAAGLGERLAAEDEARPGEQPLLDGLGEAPIGAADVAHGGEAALEHPAQDAGGVGGDVVGRPLGLRREVGRGGGDVDVAVDQAGHQRAAADVDRSGIAGAHAAPADLQDALALDEDRLVGDEHPAVRVQDRGVREEQAGWHSHGHNRGHRTTARLWSRVAPGCRSPRRAWHELSEARMTERDPRPPPTEEFATVTGAAAG